MGTHDTGGDLRPAAAPSHPDRAGTAMLSLLLLLVAGGELSPSPPHVPKPPTRVPNLRWVTGAVSRRQPHHRGAELAGGQRGGCCTL